MKAPILLIIALCCSLLHSSANNIKTITISFDKNDFEVVTNENNILEIGTNNYSASYSSNTSEPGLPLVPINVYIPKGFSYQDIQVSQNMTLYKENVIVAAAPTIIPTNITTITQEVTIPNYPPTTFPKSSVTYNGTNDFDGHTIAHLLVSPFCYDSNTKKLYFSDEFTINISLKGEAKSTNTSLQSTGALNEIIKSMVINPNDFPDNTIQTYRDDEEERVDYVVITTEALADAFKPLVDWKVTKGIRAKVVTIEYIKETYINKTIPAQIKDCLFDLFRTKGLKYVLLGGDDTVVPVLGCYGHVKFGTGEKLEEEDYTIPTDLYYACLGCMNWDLNNNGIYGEVDDNVNMTPSIFVTRLPVRTIEDIKNFNSKILTYEKTPYVWTWEDKILLSGSELYIAGDAAAKGQKLYEKYIQPYWNGESIKFYDTDTDFPQGSEYDFTADNLQDQLSMGYNFVDIISHGSPIGLQTEKGFPFTSHAIKKLTNARYTTIITTSACDTNSFDSLNPKGAHEPCLSESLIRTSSSGVIAYLGCSRTAWDYKNYRLGPSLLYEAEFYKNLFSPNMTNKNFGAVVTAAKLAMVNKCDQDGSERWTQFGLNPIGDPEMPIFTENPQSFTNISISQKGTDITIDTGIEGCRICVMDSIGGNYYNVASNVTTATFHNLPQYVSVCITKQNYIPKLYNLKIVDTVYLQNQILRGRRTIEADKVIIGSNVTNQETEGKVVFKTGPTHIKANTIILENDVEINENTTLVITNQKF